MKTDNTTETPPNDLDRYHNLLNICCKQFGKVGDILAEMNLGIRPKKLGTRWTAKATKLLLDTTSAGNAARLSVVAENRGLGDELRKAQEGFDAFAQKFICEYPDDANDTQEIFGLVARLISASESVLSVFEKVLVLIGKPVETDGLDAGLNPEKNPEDAMQFAARLVAYVWRSRNLSRRKASDFVFVTAKRGDELFAECNRCRKLKDKFDIKESSVMTNAGNIHAAENHSRHKDKTPRPASAQDRAKVSKRLANIEERMRARYKGWDRLPNEEKIGKVKKDYKRIAPEEIEDYFSPW